MRRALTLAPLAALLACHGGDSDSPVVYHPTLAFLAPTDAATIAAGDVPVSIVVEEFVLEAPESAHAAPASLPNPLGWLEATAEAHNEVGTPAGYCELSLDGTVVTQMATTQYTLTGVTAGSHTLLGHLLYADGDALDPDDIASTITFTAE